LDKQRRAFIRLQCLLRGQQTVKRSLLTWLLLSLILCVPALAQTPPAYLPANSTINWKDSGIPGGIPSRTIACSSLAAATFGNGTIDASSAMNSALNSCPAGQFVSLGTGTFRINSAVKVPSNVTLRGQGANNTIITCYVTTASCIYGGQNSGGAADDPPSLANQTPITGGLSIGSTNITVGATTGMAVGGYLLISQLNDPAYTSNTAAANAGGDICHCDGGIGWNGTRNQGQIVEITSITGGNIGITSGGQGASTNPGLYLSYSRTPVAVPFAAAAKFAGIEALQVFAENTGAQENFYFEKCMYCWADGVESNYTDGNWAEIDWSFHTQISNSYMSNAMHHTSGTNDSNITVRTFSSGWLIQNNILERGHFPLMIEWGASGGVVGYNYIFGQSDLVNFCSGACGPAQKVIDPCSTINIACTNPPAVNFHGLNPEFILVEGNTGNMFEPDNTWGSTTWITPYRNWWKGTTLICANGIAGGEGRGTVSCGTGKQAWQISSAYEIDSHATRMNLVFDILGSTEQQSLHNTQGGAALGQVPQATAQCGTGIPTPCGSNSRPFGSNAIGFSLGYFSEASPGGGAQDTSLPATTSFVHGVYSNINGSTTWAPGVTHSGPPSMYLPSKPAWFGPVNFPFNGPDTTGGIGPGGFAGKSPAQLCYESIGGTNGTGSPIAGFNADTCYQNTPPVGPAATLSTNSVSFGNQGITLQSAAQAPTVTNTGGSTLTISSIALSGANAADFAFTTSPAGGVCGGSVAVSGVCTLSIRFTPSIIGAETATLTFTDNASDSPQTMTLTGTGSYFVQGSFSYQNSGVAAQSFTFTNQVAGDLNICSVGWYDSTHTVSTPTDSNGNTYHIAGAPISIPGFGTMVTYIAYPVKGGGDTINFAFNGTVAESAVRCGEYIQYGAVDVIGTGTGTGTAVATTPATTTNANDLLIGFTWVQHAVSAPGASYTQRFIDGSANILEDQAVLSTGSYTASATQNSSGQYLVQMVALEPAGTPVPVATPTFSPVAGTYSTTQNVTISTTTPGATICYTTDGSTPTEVGNACSGGTTQTYSTPVPVSSSRTLKAIGTQSGFTDSSVGSAAYVILPIAVQPVCTPGSGIYGSTQSVTCTSSSPGAIRCYTIDGSTPATNGTTGCTTGTLYSGTISIGSSLTLKVIAGGTGYTDGSVASFVYTITSAAATPVCTPGSGTYGSAQSVTCSDATGGAIICYTLDGSAPATNHASACASGSLYTGAFSISTSSTLRAIAGGTGFSDSSIATYTYVILTTAATPVCVPGTGTYTSVQTVGCSTTSPGAIQCYTVNGSTPATNGTTGCTTGTLYAGSISVGSTLTLKVIAGGTGYMDSAVLSVPYTINLPPPPTVTSPATGIFMSLQLCSGPTIAQAGHGIATTWSVPAMFPAAFQGFYLFRCPGTCGPLSTWTLIGGLLPGTQTSYLDPAANLSAKTAYSYSVLGVNVFNAGSVPNPGTASCRSVVQ
jgi:Chitobiase/beta-hexosaminidase C-terminal domain